jgi:ribosomal protein S27AE
MIPGRDARLLTPSGKAQLVSVTYRTSSLFPVLGLEPSDLDLERDEKRCPRCGSLRLFSRRGLPGEKCPRCDDGELRYEVTAAT